MITYAASNPAKQLSTESVALKELPQNQNYIRLAQGLLGFPELNKMEVLFSNEELPFMHLRSTEDANLDFIVIEPYGLIPDYVIEIADSDAKELGIKSLEDILLINIVTVDPNAQKATVNLVGPIVINRKTLQGKQVVISNYNDYSSHHVLFHND